MRRVFPIACVVICMYSRPCLGQSPVTLQAYYDDSNQLFRVLDSNGILLEYIYDLSGNITQINRSTVAPTALSILNISPLSGTTGNTLTIYGQNFSTVSAGDIVKVNGVVATVLSATATQLVIQIPSGATSGQITVTVNGVTVTSGPTLVFTPSPTPIITSVTPDGAIAGTTLPNVTAAGTNFTGASFSFPGGATATTTNVGATTAALQVTALNTQGIFPLVATTTAGSSTSSVTPGNHFIVMTSPDEADGQSISVLNTAPPATGGTDPTNVSNQAISQVVSVLNTVPPASGGTDPTDVSNQAISQFVSVLNESSPLTGGPDPTNVSNEADSYLVSVLNNTGSSVQPHTNDNNPLFGGATGANTQGSLSISNSTEGNPALIGQLLTLAITAPSNASHVDLSVNGTKIQQSQRAPYGFVLNAPATSQDLNFTASAKTATEIEIADSSWIQKVVSDVGTRVKGRVVDQVGSPVAGAKVTVQATGLFAEYFKETPGLAGIPGLGNLVPNRTTLEAGLEWVNPNGIFGADPMGTGLSSYAARYRADLLVEDPGLYAFTIETSGLTQLKIDGQIVDGTINLTAGSHPLEVTYYKSLEPAELQLLWTPPSGLQAAIPADALIAIDSSLSATSTQTGDFAVSNVPARVSQIRVRVELSDGRIVESVWRSPVAGSVTDLSNIVIPAKQ